MRKVNFILCLLFINNNLISMPPKISKNFQNHIEGGVVALILGESYKKLTSDEQKK